MRGPQERSVPEVLQHIIGNIQDIFRSEFQLAKTEIKEEAAEARKPAATLGAGLLLAVYAMGLLLLALVYAVAMFLALWSAALLVSVSVAIVAILLINRGVKGLERHIQQQRRELGDNMRELSQKVTRAVDWRSQCEERPLMMIGIAIGGGVLLSAVIGGSRSRSQKWSSDHRPSDADGSPVWRPDVERRAKAPDQEPTGGGTWDNIKEAFVGVAAAKLGSFVEGLLPGFQEAYEKARAGNSSR